jgi:hypothetical protein
VGDEGQDGDDRAQEEPYGRSLEDREGTDLEPEALQEEHYLEAFPVDGRESEERKPEEGGASHPAGVFEYPLSPAVVEPDPTCPVDLVEEPVHYHQEYQDGQKPGRRLHVEGRSLYGGNYSHHYEPGHHRR